MALRSARVRGLFRSRWGRILIAGSGATALAVGGTALVARADDEPVQANHWQLDITGTASVTPVHFNGTRDPSCDDEVAISGDVTYLESPTSFTRRWEGSACKNAKSVVRVNAELHGYAFRVTVEIVDGDRGCTYWPVVAIESNCHWSDSAVRETKTFDVLPGQDPVAIDAAYRIGDGNVKWEGLAYDLEVHLRATNTSGVV